MPDSRKLLAISSQKGRGGLGDEVGVIGVLHKQVIRTGECHHAATRQAIAVLDQPGNSQHGRNRPFGRRVNGKPGRGTELDSVDRPNGVSENHWSSLAESSRFGRRSRHHRHLRSRWPDSSFSSKVGQMLGVARCGNRDNGPDRARRSTSLRPASLRPAPLNGSVVSNGNPAGNAERGRTTETMSDQTS